MREQDFIGLPFMPDLRAVAEQNNAALERVFKGKIKGCFLIDIKDQVMKDLGWKSFMKYYDFRWSDERMITGIGEAAEYDICRMIVGIHRARSIFLSDDEIRKNERSRRYRQQLVSEAIEKIKLRFYGSVYFRKNTLFHGEEFLYYPLPYELFVMSSKMSEMLMDGKIIHCWQLYYGVIYNGLSALSLLKGNLLGTAYPLCRGAIEMYIKLLILNTRVEFYDWYEILGCLRLNIPAARHIRRNLVYCLKSVIARIQKPKTAKYPVLHYFEISTILYFIIRETFLLLCNEKNKSDFVL